MGSDYLVKDIFNLTQMPATQKSSYKLSGTIIDADKSVDNFKINLTSCDTSTEISEFLTTLIDRAWSNDASLNWTYPEVDIDFEGKTANLTVNGYSSADPYLLVNSTNPRDPGVAADVVQGKIKVIFLGVIAPYHYLDQYKCYTYLAQNGRVRE